MRKLLSLILFVSTVLSSLAQPGQDSARKGKAQKIKAIYVAYMTQELSLTETDAQKFWPVCNEYEKELRATHKGNMDEISKEEAILNVRKKYQERYIKILGKDRTNAFFRKDAEFKKRMVDRIKEMRGRGDKGERQKGEGRGKKERRGGFDD
jgi:hypothetical protein